MSSYFAKDAVWQNIPMELVVGRTVVRDNFAGFVAGLDAMHWEIDHQVANGNMVMNERADTLHSGGHATPGQGYGCRRGHRRTQHSMARVPRYGRVQKDVGSVAPVRGPGPRRDCNEAVTSAAVRASGK
ncbi:nuclear transport factor 2 family protein [Streptomyces mirabilis]|uniref:nuclear transport factor 2 family protein n=1 Tax=Streptomyces mirabilis TaxID=68239 RepID=UPI003673EAF5